MQDLPTAPQLLKAIADLLDESVVPATSGGLAHQVRVAANLCRILEREAEVGARHQAQAAEAFATVLGIDAPDVAAVQAMSREVYDRIMAGDVVGPETANAVAGTDAAVFFAVESVVRNKLSVAKPGYGDYDYAGERRLAEQATADG